MSAKLKLVLVASIAVVLLLSGCMKGQNKCVCGEEPAESSASAKT